MKPQSYLCVILFYSSVSVLVYVQVPDVGLVRPKYVAQSELSWVQSGGSLTFPFNSPTSSSCKTPRFNKKTRAAGSGFGLLWKTFFGPPSTGRPAKDFKLNGKTDSVAERSERVNLYSRAIVILLRKTKAYATEAGPSLDRRAPVTRTGSPPPHNWLDGTDGVNAVQWNNRCLLSDPHINTLCGQNVECRTYRAINTLRLSYKNQPVNAVQWNNRCLFSDPHKTHKYTVWTECRTYRAVNTLRLSYKNQSVNAVQWNNRSLFSDPHKTHKHTVWAERTVMLR